MRQEALDQPIAPVSRVNFLASESIRTMQVWTLTRQVELCAAGRTYRIASARDINPKINPTAAVRGNIYRTLSARLILLSAPGFNVKAPKMWTRVDRARRSIGKYQRRPTIENSFMGTLVFYRGARYKRTRRIPLRRYESRLQVRRQQLIDLLIYDL